MKLTLVQKSNLKDLISLARRPRPGYQGGSYGTNADAALLRKGLILMGVHVSKGDAFWVKGARLPRMVISPLGWEVAKEHGLLDEGAVYPEGYDKMDPP